MHPAVLFATMFVACQADQPADLVLRGGSVVTMDPTLPRAEALAIRDGRIIAIGDEAQIASWIGPRTKVLQLDGHCAFPGFIEGHAHFLGLGQSKQILDLTKASTWDEVVQLVVDAAEETPRGRWILGRGWHQEKWRTLPEPNIDDNPYHTLLSDRVPDHPVLLHHASGHAAIANAAAMRLAGVNRDTPDPAGGQILRDPRGQPIGVFREDATALIDQQVTASYSSADGTARAMTSATEECLAHGVTSFHDAGSSFETIRYFQQLADRGQLRVRLWVMVSDGYERMRRLLPRYRVIGAGNGFLTVRAIKLFADGALGSHGAWLLAPYDDLPQNVGMATTSLGTLRRVARLAMEHEYQLCTHAIGDRANREVLDIYEQAFAECPCDESRRWRIEHAQHLHPADIPRFAKLGVIASMQGIHCTSDSGFVIERLGSRRAAEGAYAWRSLLNSGAILANGTDAPVEKLDPIANFYASVTRRPKGGDAFFPSQCMTREQALRSYTLDAAYAAFEEHVKGSLAVGKYADIVVLSQNLLTCAADDILKTRVLCTIVDGRVEYEAK
jgi:predicted amidohydrolase YtcJ